MFDLIVNPFITLLAVLYQVLGNNTVLAIAVLTVAIRLLTSPLMIQQQRSTKAMQEIQPKLKQIQEKYKNDREKLSQEQMALYREHGINPLGGCLPLIVQLPILLALYQAIILALAATPFQLIDLSGRLLVPGLDNLVPLNNIWLNMDLTLPPTTNPTYALALPVFVMITTWLQSKLTMPAPAPVEDGKPNQAAAMTRSMTTIMPLMFGFFSLSFSVGLSIYFVVSNLVGILQYSLMGRAEWGRLFGREPQETGATPTIVTGQATKVEAKGNQVKEIPSSTKPSPSKQEKNDDQPVKRKAKPKARSRSSGNAK
ncbi:MAG: YidC/Oxa1 family membrane protein insertase [Aggregatilineales bacterium]